ncbi:hypothetical protein B6U91_01975 [Candidatus Pacearchaeota archaeon ex4484_71]|nr:MAG: hypothetical protein B6U91_01975 [Candidatus Pacearchaeota archaeon ex4484_71]
MVRKTKNTPNPWYVYILECLDGSFYTGITKDVNSRMLAHASGVWMDLSTLALQRMLILVCWHMHLGREANMLREEVSKDC